MSFQVSFTNLSLFKFSPNVNTFCHALFSNSLRIKRNHLLNPALAPALHGISPNFLAGSLKQVEKFYMIKIFFS